MVSRGDAEARGDAGWQVGDLALCVTRKHWFYGRPSSVLEVGAIYTVATVGAPIRKVNGERALGFHEVVPPGGGNYGFPESCFRKLTPPEADEFDREVIAAMTGTPVPELVPASACPREGGEPRAARPTGRPQAPRSSIANSAEDQAPGWARGGQK